MHASDILFKFLEPFGMLFCSVVEQVAPHDSHDSILWFSTNQKKENGFLLPLYWTYLVVYGKYPWLEQIWQNYVSYVLRKKKIVNEENLF